MRRFGPLLLTAALLGAAVPVMAVSEPAADDLEHNRRVLDRYRADPDHYARLLRDLHAFQAMPPDHRERMRQFDRDLHDEDPATQDRLWTVMERYTDWVGRLSEANQKRMADAPNGAERLAVVKELRQNEWIDRLPKKDRDDLLALPPAEQPKRLADLRQKERQRRKDWVDWANAIKTRPAPPPGARPNRPAALADFPDDVQTFVKDKLTPKLSDDEKQRLDRASQARWPVLANTIQDLSEDHHLTPPGPRELWTNARGVLPEVPYKVLMEFFNTELGPDEKATLRAVRDEDPAEFHEMLKQDYFKKYPNLISKWRRFDRQGRP